MLKASSRDCWTDETQSEPFVNEELFTEALALLAAAEDRMAMYDPHTVVRENIRDFLRRVETANKSITA